MDIDMSHLESGHITGTMKHAPFAHTHKKFFSPYIASCSLSNSANDSKTYFLKLYASSEPSLSTTDIDQESTELYRQGMCNQVILTFILKVCFIYQSTAFTFIL